jgi:hypothetical protein
MASVIYRDVQKKSQKSRGCRNLRLFKISNLFSKILQLRRKLCESNANFLQQINRVFALYLAKEIFSGSFT